MGAVKWDPLGMLLPEEENAGLTIDKAVDQPRIPTGKGDAAVTEGARHPRRLTSATLRTATPAGSPLSTPALPGARPRHAVCELEARMAPHAKCHLLPWTRLAVGAETALRVLESRQSPQPLRAARTPRPAAPAAAARCGSQVPRLPSPWARRCGGRASPCPRLRRRGEGTRLGARPPAAAHPLPGCPPQRSQPRDWPGPGCHCRGNRTEAQGRR